ncbi:hypothetical protein WN51_02935 [Melipona quadrifasciata]|uniref:Uncharacterized protein n=1 Tax=Melipona quadrifasciata TaxID=166423 RepID=A0A0M9ABC6_9HYME|nr:hypothetical protein WN51_02935 [Melipona quadrifasciata]
MQQQHLEGSDQTLKEDATLRTEHTWHRERAQRTTLHAAPPPNADERRRPGVRTHASAECKLRRTYAHTGCTL